MIPLMDYQDNFTIMRLLIYGMSKSGKSTLAATLAKDYHMIWIDLENATETLIKLPDEMKRNIDIVRIPDSASNPVGCNTILNLLKFKKADICLKHGLINCPACLRGGGVIQKVDLTNLNPRKDIVVIDSLTQFGLSMLAYVLKDRDFEYKPERDDWGEVRRYSEYGASQIQGAPFNLIVTATPVEVAMEDKRVKLVPQYGSKDMSQNVMAKFSTVIFTEVVNKQHKAYSRSTASNMFVTGSRSGQAIENLAEPSLLPIFKEYMEGKIEQTKTVNSTASRATDSAKIALPSGEAKAINKLIGLKLGKN